MEQHIPLVFAICKRMGVPTPIEDSDEFAEGCLALAKYAPKYDGRGAISTYLYPCIRGRILRWRKTQMQQTGVADSRIGLENYRPFMELKDGPAPGSRVAPDRPEVDAAMRTLPPRTREYIERHFAGESMRSIGRDDGLSANRVHQIVTAALEKLRYVCAPGRLQRLRRESNRVRTPLRGAREGACAGPEPACPPEHGADESRSALGAGG